MIAKSFSSMDISELVEAGSLICDGSSAVAGALALDTTIEQLSTEALVSAVFHLSTQFDLLQNILTEIAGKAPCDRGEALV